MLLMSNVPNKHKKFNINVYTLIYGSTFLFRIINENKNRFDGSQKNH